MKNNHYSSLLKLGAPVVVGQIGNLVLNFADTFMIGHHSTVELAAASFVNNIFVLVLLFALGFNFALTPMIGPFIGRDEKEKAGTVMRTALFANALLTVVLIAVSVAFYFSLPYFGQPDELLPLMRPYLLVNILSIPFAVLGCQLKQFFDTIGRTSISMYVLITANCINILGNYLLIYGHFGFPELGLLGAGVATALSRVVIFLFFSLTYVFRKECSVFYRGTLKPAGNEARQLFRQINSLGWMSAIQSTVECGAFSLVAVFVGWTGTKPLAAHQVMITLSLFFYNLYLGIGTAVSIRVSHFVGMRERQAIIDVTKSGFVIILAMSMTVAVPIFLFRHSLGSMFTSDPVVCSLVASTVIPLLVYQVSDAFQCCLANALRGLGEMRRMMYAAFVAYFLVSIPLSWLFGIRLGYGLVGIWSAFPICLTVAGVLYYAIFRKRILNFQSP